MKRILCWLGFHIWLYSFNSDEMPPSNGEIRQCLRCDKRQRLIVSTMEPNHWISEIDYNKAREVLKELLEHE